MLPIAGVGVGIAICWNVAFDDLVRDSVRNGAQFLAVPSDNATFGRTEMAYQQQRCPGCGPSSTTGRGDRRDQRISLHATTTLATRLGALAKAAHL